MRWHANAVPLGIRRVALYVGASAGSSKVWRPSVGWLAAPAVMFLCALFAYPLMNMLTVSVSDPSFTLKHYRALAATGVYLKVGLLTFKLALGVTFICLLLGYPVAYVIAAARPNIRPLLMIPIMLPFLTSLLVRTYAWMVLLGRQGVINQALLSLGFVEEPLLLVHNSIGVHVGMVQILLPFMVLPLYSVMVGIDRQLLRAAYNLGASPWTAFRRVFLPLSLPGVAAGCSLVFIIALGFFVTPALLGGVGDVTISMLIEQQVGETLNWGFASALAVALFVITLALVVVMSRFLGFEKIWMPRA